MSSRWNKIQHRFTQIQSYKYFRYSISIPAGGWVNVIDPKDDQGADILDFEVFRSDGTPYEYERLAS